jgi:hypothetical protein
MYSVCTRTWFLYWYVHGMYFTLLYNASMYKYVLDKTRTIFSRYDAVTQSWNVTEYLPWHITAYLSVQFKKIQCSLVAQYSWSVLGMYRVHTRDVLVLTVTNMYQKHFIFNQACSALRRWRVSAARFIRSTALAICLSAVSSTVRPPRRGLALQQSICGPAFLKIITVMSQ